MLDGVFEDEYGRYPAGTYLRDPIGSSHAPFTTAGCTLFVKLWQFAKDDDARFVIDTATGVWEEAPEGFAIQRLHRFAGVSTFLIRLAPGQRLNRNLDPGGEEVLVLAGAFGDEEGDYPVWTWIRDPGGGQRSLVSEPGCTLLVKTGHLPPDLADTRRLAKQGADG